MVLGGPSSLNTKVYVRGNAEDFNRWERDGAKGWSFADCLPYFKRSQSHQLGPNEHRWGDGPLLVSRGQSDNPLYRAFIDAGAQVGHPFTEDFNGRDQEDVGYYDNTIHKGRRWSTAIQTQAAQAWMAMLLPMLEEDDNNSSEILLQCLYSAVMGRRLANQHLNAMLISLDNCTEKESNAAEHPEVDDLGESLRAERNSQLPLLYKVISVAHDNYLNLLDLLEKNWFKFNVSPSSVDEEDCALRFDLADYVSDDCGPLVVWRPQI